MAKRKKKTGPKARSKRKPKIERKFVVVSRSEMGEMAITVFPEALAAIKFANECECEGFAVFVRWVE